MSDLVVVVDSRLWLPTGLPRDLTKALREEFTHSDPDYFKKKAMGYSVWGQASQIKTADLRPSPLGKRLTLPRGGIGRLVQIAADHGYRVRFMDRRVSEPVEFHTFRVSPNVPGATLRYYQEAAVAAALKYQSGVIRAPTGSGKTIAALAFIARANERALVIMRDGNLLKQWIRVASACLGMDSSEIGIIRGGKWKPGDRLTLALQQSLAKGSKLAALLERERFGAVIVDECQLVAAKTFLAVIGEFPAKYRIGFSADETRRDKREFLIYDAIGPVMTEIHRQDLEDKGVIHPVTIRVVETDFRADWYRNAEPADRDFKRLIDEMSEDADRNAMIVNVVEALVRSGETPALVFAHRREHAIAIADRELSVQRGILCGVLLGGDGVDRERFQDDLGKLQSGRLKVAVGTYNAVGVGLDLPLVRAGVAATPISASNRQFFGQVRGRICRTAEGKDDAVIYYLWDRHVFPNQIRALQDWNDGRVEIRDGDRWVRIPG